MGRVCQRHEQFIADGAECPYCEPMAAPAGLESGAAMSARGVRGSIWDGVDRGVWGGVAPWKSGAVDSRSLEEALIEAAALIRQRGDEPDVAESYPEWHLRVYGVRPPPTISPNNVLVRHFRRRERFADEVQRRANNNATAAPLPSEPHHWASNRDACERCGMTGQQIFATGALICGGQGA